MYIYIYIYIYIYYTTQKYMYSHTNMIYIYIYIYIYILNKNIYMHVYWRLQTDRKIYRFTFHINYMICSALVSGSSHRGHSVCEHNARLTYMYTHISMYLPRTLSFVLSPTVDSEYFLLNKH